MHDESSCPVGRSMAGDVKFPRNILESGIVSDPHHLAIWTWLMLLAAFKRHCVFFNGTRIELLPGQLVTSLRILSGRTGICKTRVETILRNLNAEGLIGHRSTNKYSLITLLNWKRDQPIGTQNGRRRDRREEGKRNIKSHQSFIHTDEFLLEMDSKKYK